MTIRERINRWRHDFGYGVHSPLGFRIVREVLNPSRGYGFYGYERLEGLAASLDPVVEKRARMLLRLGVLRQPSILWHSSDTPEIYTEALKLAGGIVRILDGSVFPDDMAKGEMILINGFLPDDISKLLELPDKTIVCLDVGKDNVKKLASMIKQGIMFDAVDSALIITGPGLSRMVYTLSKSKI